MINWERIFTIPFTVCNFQVHNSLMLFNICKDYVEGFSNEPFPLNTLSFPDNIMNPRVVSVD